MADDEKIEQMSRSSGDAVGLLDSIFELLKGGRDQVCQRASFGLEKYWDETEQCMMYVEIKPGASASVWFNQLCCAEILDCFNQKLKGTYSNNHAYTGMVNQQKNDKNERRYLKYLKPGLEEHGRRMIAEEQKYLLELLERGVGLYRYLNDWDSKEGGSESKVIREDTADGEISAVKIQKPEGLQQAVFGHDGIRNRFLEPEIARRSRITDGEPKDSGHRKKEQKLPGPYEVLRRRKRADGKPQYTWFVTRASRGYLASCTDREIFFGVLAAAFVLGLNLDEDKEIDSRVEEYLKDLVGDNQDIKEFKLLLTEFFEEENPAGLCAGSYRLGETIKMLIGSGWDKKELKVLLQSRKNADGQEMDEIRNLYLDWLEKRAEGESLFRELTAGGLDAYFEKKSALDVCVAEMKHLKTTADERLDRLLKQNGDEKKAVAQITAQTPYTIEF